MFSSLDLSIDLGTANTLVYSKGKGIIINEPSVVAINTKTNTVLAVGVEAKKMVGKTPQHIVAVRPLVNGIISDFEVTEKMLKYFIEKAIQKKSLFFNPKPRVIIGIPSEVTEVERKAVQDAVLSGGGRRVFLIEQPIASAIGCRLNIQDPGGHMIVEIGGGTTEIAVISLGGIVTSTSLKLAGDALNNDIIDYARERFNMLLGERTSENIKIQIGSAVELDTPLESTIKGRDLLTGLPKEIVITDTMIREALSKTLSIITEAVKDTIERTPPELVADLYDRGIVLSGGGAYVRGLDKLISNRVKIPVYIADDPLTSVVRGSGAVLEDLDSLGEILLANIE